MNPAIFIVGITVVFGVVYSFGIFPENYINNTNAVYSRRILISILYLLCLTLSALLLFLFYKPTASRWWLTCSAAALAAFASSTVKAVAGLGVKSISGDVPGLLTGAVQFQDPSYDTLAVIVISAIALERFSKRYVHHWKLGE